MRLSKGLMVALCAALLAGPVAAAPILQDRVAVAAAVRAPVDQLLADAEHEHPAALFVLAKRLYDSGRRDEAVFWFYVGQIRWRAYLSQNPDLNGGAGPFSEKEGDRFDQWMAYLGPTINGWAAGDVETLLATLQAALDWDAAHPDDYTPAGEARAKSRDGLGDLMAMVRDQRAELVARNPQRKPGAPAPDLYSGDGWAMSGMPSAPLQTLDPVRFKGLRKGASRAEVIQAVGAPDWWMTDADGSSILGYSFAKPGMEAIGFVQVVQASLSFDAKGRLTKIDLPDS